MIESCTFKGRSKDSITLRGDTERERSNGRAGFVVYGRKLPGCPLLQDLKFKGPQSFCVLSELDERTCPVAKFYFREITSEQANNELRELGMPFLTLKAEQPV